MAHLDKFVHTRTGKYIMSILLGFGLASLFRKVCNNYNCINFYAAPIKDINDKVYKKDNNKCVKYVPLATKCDNNKKIVEYE